jgi:hypothetical protein
VTVVISLAATAEQQPGNPPIAPGKHCSRTCGNVDIPFPFGVESGCYLPGFQIVCNKTFQPPRPFLDGKVTDWSLRGYQKSGGWFGLPSDDLITPSPMELKEVSVEQGEVKVLGALSSNCPANHTHNSFVGQLFEAASPFHISRRNVLIGIGMNVDSGLTTWMDRNDSDVADTNNCVSRVPPWKRPEDGPACTGKGCCEAASNKVQVLGHVAVITVDMVNNKSKWYGIRDCSFGMLVEKGWYNFTVGDAYGNETYMANKFPRGVPLVLEFAIRGGACPSAQGQRPPNNYACISGNSSCVGATDGDGYRCRCSQGYEGNPYIADGCKGTIKLTCTSKNYI